jgi:ketosteroid isomerase-like protein
MSNMIAEVTTEFLQAFADAWNRHNADALMSFMSDDCVFEASAGPDICGSRYVGP